MTKIGSLEVNLGQRWIGTRLREELRFRRSRRPGDKIEFKALHSGRTLCRRKHSGLALGASELGMALGASDPGMALGVSHSGIALGARDPGNGTRSERIWDGTRSE